MKIFGATPDLAHDLKVSFAPAEIGGFQRLGCRSMLLFSTFVQNKSGPHENLFQRKLTRVDAFEPFEQPGALRSLMFGVL